MFGGFGYWTANIIGGFAFWTANHVWWICFVGPLMMSGGFAFWTADHVRWICFLDLSKVGCCPCVLSIFLEAYTCCLEARHNGAGLFLLLDSFGKGGNK